MKRNEAIEEIRKILAVNGKDDGYGELEEAILHHLEAIGMLPPLNDWSLHTDGDKADTDNIRYYTWEPEDET
jgi:hypothetical protein